MKVVSERLGHANIAFTIQTYQHLLPGMQADAARTVERLHPTRSAARDRHGGTPEDVKVRYPADRSAPVPT